MLEIFFIGLKTLGSGPSFSTSTGGSGAGALGVRIPRSWKLEPVESCVKWTDAQDIFFHTHLYSGGLKYSPKNIIFTRTRNMLCCIRMIPKLNLSLIPDYTLFYNYVRVFKYGLK